MTVEHNPVHPKDFHPGSEVLVLILNELRAIHDHIDANEQRPAEPPSVVEPAKAAPRAAQRAQPPKKSTK